MAYNLNNMARIAQVGQKLKFRDMPTLDFSGAIDNYLNARDAADKRAQMAEQAQKEQAYSEALQSGDQDAINQAWAAYDPQGYSNYINQQQQRAEDRQWALEDMARKEQAAYNLAAFKNKLAQSAGIGGANSPFNSKNEFINLMAIKNNPDVWDNLPNESKSLVNARLSFLSNAPENVFEKSYQGQRGKEIAKQEVADLQNAIQNQQQYGKVDNAIALVESMPDDMFKPYTAVSGYVGALTDGNVGMSAQDQQAYGELERTIGSLQNDLLQKARSKGQSGINTLAEIRQATKGLQYDRGKERLLGALKQLQQIEYKLDAIPTMMSVRPQSVGAPSDDDAWGGI